MLLLQKEAAYDGGELLEVVFVVSCDDDSGISFKNYQVYETQEHTNFGIVFIKIIRFLYSIEIWSGKRPWQAK